LPTFLLDDVQYNLVQWHCHTGSEHTVEGYQYPAECHFVHAFEGESDTLYAVIGVFLIDSATTKNAAFGELLDHLPTTANWVEQDLNINFDWSSIINGVSLEHYWSYDGSFTTPNCAENVKWTVLKDVVEVTPAQIEQMIITSGFDNNFRPPMPLYGRVVEDGSEIVSFNVIWDVTICCIDVEQVLDITAPVSKVLGLAEDDMEVISWTVNGVNGWNIEYEITISENTETFQTHLLRNLDEVQFMDIIISQIQTDSEISSVSKFESVSVSLDNTGKSWHYPYDVTEWGEVAEICKTGKMQSPIDLPQHPNMKQTAVQTTLGLRSNLIASHVHSLQWTLDTEDSPTLYVNGLKYELLQWHCHTGSEHTVNRYQYPAECHFVHYFERTSGSQYAVLGVFLDDGASSPNPAFSDLLDDLPATDNWGEQDMNIDFEWSSVISGVDLEYYWAYIGSFTTPTCDENVQWTVLRDVVQVTPSQIEQMETTSGFDNNFRPPKPLHGRVVRDGSNIVNATLTWQVNTCCMDEENVLEMTSSVATVIGLLEKDIQIISLNGHDDSSWDIKYEVAVIDNTESFLTYLLQNLYDDIFVESIRAQIETDLQLQSMDTFNSLSVVHDYESGVNNTVVEALIICLLVLLFLVLMAIAVMKKTKLEKAVANEETHEESYNAMSQL